MDKKLITALAELTSNEGALTPVGKAALRSRIAYLESELANAPQKDFPPTHHFSQDVYAREMHMKADDIVIGAIHKKKNLNK